jgi:uroporphyrinogen-III decarboxylase
LESPALPHHLVDLAAGSRVGGTGEPLVRCAADVARIPDPDPLSQGRYPVMLDALRRIRQALGNEIFLVACFDQYPFSLACELLGIERAMLCMEDGRALLDAVMERGLEYAAAYARALADAGADMLSGGDSPAGLLGPRFYREVALPAEKRLIDRHNAETHVPISLHICGDARAILAEMAASGADVWSWIAVCRLTRPPAVWVLASESGAISIPWWFWPREPPTRCAG